MESGELIDELREGGLREVWFYWQKIETDVEFEPLTEWLVMDEKGVILARKVAPPEGAIGRFFMVQEGLRCFRSLATLFNMTWPTKSQ